MTSKVGVRWTVVAAVIGLLAILAGCAPDRGDGGLPPEQVAGQRAMLDALRAELGLTRDGPLACNVDDPQAFVRQATVEGDNCFTFKVQVGGFTQACVAQRDDRARLRALRQVAAAECQEFCRSLGCPASSLVRQDDCASANAFRSDECPDAEECPLLNYCTLRGALDLQNCVCGGP